MRISCCLLCCVKGSHRFLISEIFFSSGPSDNGLVTQNERSYVTVAAVPSLKNCEECQKVAASFEEEGILGYFVHSKIFSNQVFMTTYNCIPCIVCRYCCKLGQLCEIELPCSWPNSSYFL